MLLKIAYTLKRLTLVTLVAGIMMQSALFAGQSNKLDFEKFKKKIEIYIVQLDIGKLTLDDMPNEEQIFLYNHLLHPCGQKILLEKLKKLPSADDFKTFEERVMPRKTKEDGTPCSDTINTIKQYFHYALPQYQTTTTNTLSWFSWGPTLPSCPEKWSAKKYDSIMEYLSRINDIFESNPSVIGKINAITLIIDDIKTVDTSIIKDLKHFFEAKRITTNLYNNLKILLKTENDEKILDTALTKYASETEDSLILEHKRTRIASHKETVTYLSESILPALAEAVGIKIQPHSTITQTTSTSHADQEIIKNNETLISKIINTHPKYLLILVGALAISGTTYWFYGPTKDNVAQNEESDEEFYQKEDAKKARLSGKKSVPAPEPQIEELD